MSARTKALVTALILVFLVGSFAFGYFLGGQQARKGFPEEVEMWQKEAGVKMADSVSPNTVWFPDGAYRMYYSVQEGIASAVSYNGTVWTKEEGVRIAADPLDKRQAKVGGPAVFELKNGKYMMIYEGSDESGSKRYLFSALSPDGLVWTRQKKVLLKEENIVGQDFASAPAIVRLSDGKLRLYYSNGTSIGSAISRNEGKTWTKEAVSGIEETAVDVDVVLREEGAYKMYYTVSSSQSELKKLRIVSATSEDGLRWKRDKGIRIESDVGAKMVFDPDVIRVSKGKYRMYYCQLDSGSLEQRRSWEEHEEPTVISIRSATLELR